jgi:long-chain acyl-CoA synthetase
MQADFWNDKRPAGVPSHIDLAAYKSVVEVFERSCKRFADRPAFSNMGVTLSYAELDRLSAAFAAYLQQHTDLVPGDRIAVQMPNVLQYPSPCSVPCAPGWSWSTPTRCTPPARCATSSRTRAPARWCTSTCSASGAGSAARYRIEYLIEAKMGDLLPTAKGWLVNTVVDK